MSDQQQKPKDVVVLVLSGRGRSDRVNVPFILTASAIEAHNISLWRARNYFREEGYVRSNGQDIPFPINKNTKGFGPLGTSRLEVWVKY